jgi:alkylation response protein AidB-like acyl-CoA dehydrogenase
MSDFYYDDLLFIMEKCIPWNDIASLRGKVGNIDEYLMTLKTVIRFCEGQVEPKAEEIDREECCLEGDSKENRRVCIPHAMEENLNNLKKLGFFCGATFPEEYGGYDFPMSAFFSLGEVFSMADSSIGLTPMLQEGVGQVLLEFANEKILSEYLPKLISGERYGGMGLTEPGAGSDLAVMQTTAQPVNSGSTNNSRRIKELQELGDVYLINGSKIFITNGFGDVLTLAQTGEGISMFLVFQEDKEVARVEKKLGIKGSPTCELYYEDSPGILIGKPGEGLVPNMMKLMNIARLGVATQGLGIAQRAHTLAKNYATNDRIQFGVPIIELPPVRQIIFENEIDIQATRILTYTAAFYFDMRETSRWKMKHLNNDTDEYRELRKKQQRYSRIAEILIPLAKYDAAELSNRVTYSSLQVFGGYGFTKEYPLERLYRDARITSIYEGTSQIQIDQVFNESFYFEKLGLINQFKMGDEKTFVETDKNRLFMDNLLNEFRDEITQKSKGRPSVDALLDALDSMRNDLKEVRQSLFIEEKKRGKEMGKKYNSLHQREYVDIIGAIIKGYLLLKQAIISEHKELIAKAYINRMVIATEHCRKRIMSGIDDVIGDEYLRVMQ